MLRLTFKTLLLLAGIALIAWGYSLLSVPPDADHDLMLRHAKGGMLSVIAGGVMIMIWLAKR